MKLSLNKSRIIDNIKITENFYLLKFENKNPDSPKTGQFINIKINNKLNPFLRRPFAVFDFNKKVISILYKVVGETTQLMSALETDEEIEYFGFLGNPFNINLKNKNIWVAAGGIGIGGINLFLQKIKNHNKIELFLGFNRIREAENISKFLKIKDLKINSAVMEQNKSFFHGDIVRLIKKQKSKPDAIFACGPEPMLKSLFQEYIQKNNITAYFSLESIMACGIGTCMGCTVKIKEKNSIKQKRVCKDGPVFNAKEIVWEK